MLKLILLQTGSIFLPFLGLIMFSCTPSGQATSPDKLQFSSIDIPKMGPAYYPNLLVAEDQLFMNWVEDLNDTISQLKYASWDGNLWSQPELIAQGRDWFVNWADFPALGQAKNGQMAAHYLSKVGSGTYAYGIFMSQSDSEKKNWQSIGTPHLDTSQTEHGFMSMFSLGNDLGMVWLDGRRYATADKQMELRFNTLGSSYQFGGEVLLDERVCDCCQTGAVATNSGAVVVYRNRSEEEIRDIYRVVLKDGKWSAPAPIHHDNWKITGCPVNGPAIDAEGDLVAVAWYTKPGDSAEVKVAFSQDGGETFWLVTRIDEGNPEGRVDILMENETYGWVSWMENKGKDAEVLIRKVYTNGKKGPVHKVGAISASRSSGFPVLKKFQNHLYLSWTVPGTESRLRLMQAPL